MSISPRTVRLGGAEQVTTLVRTLTGGLEMGRIVVMNHVTLDGVMQGPGRVDEDTRGGFRHSGWGQRHEAPPDDALQHAMGERMTTGGGLRGWLFGRRTYEDLLGYWHGQPDSPFGPMLNDTPKYVVSSTLAEPLPWPNSTLLRGPVADAVGELKAHTDGVLGIMGSGELIGTLMTADLIDEFLMLMHPLVLGSGRRLFPDDGVTSLRLLKSTSTSSGVVIAAYERVGEST
jgi:dihydrofolate reductase